MKLPIFKKRLILKEQDKKLSGKSLTWLFSAELI